MLEGVTIRFFDTTLMIQHRGIIDIFKMMLNSSGIVGRISPKTWAAMETFLESFATEDYEAMASSLIQMGATEKDVDVKAFARDLEKLFSSIQVCYITFSDHIFAAL